MSWRDRPYSEPPPPPQWNLQLGRPGTIVGWLIVINVIVFFLDLMVQHLIPDTHRIVGLSLRGISRFFIWQPITYMFFHADPMHLLFNMLGLYVFGSEFERAFGGRRLLQFYGTCGFVGGIAYLILSISVHRFFPIPLVGASGAIYGLLVAAVIFFPHIQVILIVFPMPIRVFAMIMAAILLMQILSPGGISNPGGEICHLAGAATGILLFKVWGLLPTLRGSPLFPVLFSDRQRQQQTEKAWEKKLRKIADEENEVDRILAKVHAQGLQSLTRAEKNLLARATRRQKEHERDAGRIDRL